MCASLFGVDLSITAKSKEDVSACKTGVNFLYCAVAA